MALTHETAQEASFRLMLRPDPFEGWSREVAHALGARREVLQLIEATAPVPWHRLNARVLYAWEEGGPLAVSRSADGVEASCVTLGGVAGQPREAELPAGEVRTLEAVGAWSVVRMVIEPDLKLTDRALMPDDWFPGPAGLPSSA